MGVPAPPGGGPTAMPDALPRQYALTADITQEYAAGGYFAPLGDYARTLPAWIDPVTRDFGLDTYQRMVRTDPQVASCIEVYKTDVLSDGWRLSPAQDAEGKAIVGGRVRGQSSDDARRACDLCDYCLTNLFKTPFDLFLRQMLDAMYEGHKVSEKVYRIEDTGPWAGYLVLDRLKPKPPRSTAFVMDAYDNLLGLLGLMPNVPFYGMWPAFGTISGTGFLPTPGDGKKDLQKAAPNILPRSKFCVLTWDGQDGSPQGRSLLQRAFTPWWWKANGYAIWGQLISKHADPSLVGTTAEGAQNIPDPSGAQNPDGSPVLVDPISLMSRMLAGFKNGSAIALPFGSTVAALQVNNTGEAIAAFMDWCNREIAKAVLGQTLATEEGKYGTRAQASVHGEVKGDVTRYGRVALTCMVVGDVLRDIVFRNFGPGNDHLIPEFGLGQDETMSFADFAAGTSSLVTSGFADVSQYQGLDEMGGLPPRDEAAWQQAMDLKRRQAEQAVALGDKAAQETPGDKGNEGQAVIDKSK